MSKSYTRDISEILDAFIESAEAKESLSDEVLSQLRQMIAKRKMDDAAEIDTVVSMLTGEANELHD
jgi:alpha-D-ribose 1-methylphosphonate 5-triphosphate synthase subunit PhnG